MNELVNIHYVLEGCLMEHLDTHSFYPDYIYLGERECNRLDKLYGGIVFEFMNMEIIMVMKRSFVGFGNKLEII